MMSFILRNVIDASLRRIILLINLYVVSVCRSYLTFILPLNFISILIALIDAYARKALFLNCT